MSIREAPMSTTVTAYWPGITKAQLDDEPSLSDDGHNWGQWMAEREDQPDVLRAVAELGGTALLTTMTDGWEDDDVEWATPQELRAAALRLGQAVRDNRPGIARILETYGRHADDTTPIAEQFLTDLAEIAALATWAESYGTDRITLSVNF
jgi:hypothetical protein